MEVVCRRNSAFERGDETDFGKRGEITMVEILCHTWDLKPKIKEGFEDDS